MGINNIAMKMAAEERDAMAQLERDAIAATRGGDYAAAAQYTVMAQYRKGVYRGINRLLMALNAEANIRGEENADASSN